MTRASRSIVIDVEPEVLYDIIVDFRKYPEFVKEVTKVRIDSESENQWTATFFISMIKKLDYSLVLIGERPLSVTWSLAKKGFMKKNDGAWALKDLGDGKTEATYSAEIDLGLLAPKSIVNMLMSSNFPTMLSAFKKRAEGL